MLFSSWFQQQVFQSQLPNRCLNTTHLERWRRVSSLQRILYYMIGLGLIFWRFHVLCFAVDVLPSGETRIWFASCVVFLGQLLFSHRCLFYEAFFQGFNNMKPYALSQIAEQIIRVIWMLLATFFIMKIGTGDYVTAVVQSTFAAFIGMLASYGVLFFYLWRRVNSRVFWQQAVHPDINQLQLLLKPLGSHSFHYYWVSSSTFPVDWPMDLYPYYGEVYKL